MGLLDQQQGMGPQMDPQMMQQIFSMMQQQNVNPFVRPLPGDVYLPGQAENPFTGGQPAQYDPRAQLPEGVSSQVAQSQRLPGLPNFPKQMGGFGLGAMVPKMHNQGVGMQAKAPQDLMGGGNPFAGSSPDNMALGQLSGGVNPMLKNRMLQDFLSQSIGQGGNIGTTGQF